VRIVSAGGFQGLYGNSPDGQWGLQERAVIWSGRYAAASLAGIAEGVMMKVGGQLDK
jgi:hypothetical protein